MSPPLPAPGRARSWSVTCPSTPTKHRRKRWPTRACSSRPGAEAVKLEGGVSVVPEIEALRAAGIAVMGHIGMLPQSVKEEGGYKIKGRSEEERERLLADARAVEAAGAFAIVMELVEPETAALITRSVGIPTIGIGSGAGCDGQILVTHDLTGNFPWFRPKFAVARADVASAIRGAAESFVRDVTGK